MNQSDFSKSWSAFLTELVNLERHKIKRLSKRQHEEYSGLIEGIAEDANRTTVDLDNALAEVEQTSALPVRVHIQRELDIAKRAASKAESDKSIDAALSIGKTVIESIKEIVDKAGEKFWSVWIVMEILGEGADLVKAISSKRGPPHKRKP